MDLTRSSFNSTVAAQSGGTGFNFFRGTRFASLRYKPRFGVTGQIGASVSSPVAEASQSGRSPSDSYLLPLGLLVAHGWHR